MAIKVFADSCANMPVQYAKEHDISIVAIPYIIDGEEKRSCLEKDEEELKAYYQLLRDKKKTTTACINEQDFIDTFTPVLESGDDVLYFCFSSGLSKTYECSQNAVKVLQEQFPDRKIKTIDTLCECTGIVVLIDKCLKLLNDGATFDEIETYCINNRQKVNHIFTVDDIGFLFRGGRVKATSYAIASILKIKPVLHVDENGKLVPYTKVMGRKKSLNEVVDKVASKIVDGENQIVYIAHGDCLEDALYVKEQILSRVKVREVFVDYLDPVIATHSGPGTIALFFSGEDRKI